MGDSGLAGAVAQDSVAEEAAAAARGVAEVGVAVTARPAPAVETAVRALRICGRRVRAEDRLADLVRDWAEAWESEGAPEQDLDRAREEAERARELDPALARVQARVLVPALGADRVVRELEQAVQDLEAVVRGSVAVVRESAVRVLAAMVLELAAARELEAGEEPARVAGSPEGGWRRPPKFEGLHLQD